MGETPATTDYMEPLIQGTSDEGYQRAQKVIATHPNWTLTPPAQARSNGTEWSLRGPRVTREMGEDAGIKIAEEFQAVAVTFADGEELLAGVDFGWDVRQSASVTIEIGDSAASDPQIGL